MNLSDNNRNNGCLSGLKTAGKRTPKKNQKTKPFKVTGMVRTPLSGADYMGGFIYQNILDIYLRSVLVTLCIFFHLKI